MRVRPLIVLVCLALAACSDPGKPTIQQPVAEPSSAAAPAPPLATVALTPAKTSTDVPVSAEIGLTVTNGTVKSVVLTDGAGATLEGELRSDGSSWVPTNALKFDSAYTATVTAEGSDGKAVTETTEFRTMTKPGKRLGTGLYVSSGRSYGVAMPVVVEFTSNVPQAARATIQKRLFIKTDPPQEGAWSWISSKQIMYRGKEFWKTGTKIEVRAALEGLPIGDGRYGDADRKATMSIAKDRIELITDDDTHQMTVKKNGEVIKTIPVSLGKDSTPTSSGTMVIMAKHEHTVFDTTTDPDATDRYRVEVDHAQRLTWGGEFIHSAPWSVKDQGVRNVSHGCTNVSPANAKWLFDITRIGDPYTVKGTSRKLAPGNGFTAWAVSWDDFIKGSALPVGAS
ncbi:MAG TPA: Ig-like domain-containing protein [Candidatus Limnocylindrales bacterium]